MASAPSRFVRDFPVYFGWPVTVAAAVAMAATLPGQTPGVSLACTDAAVGSAAVLLFESRALDRWGPRWDRGDRDAVPVSSLITIPRTLPLVFAVALVGCSTHTLRPT